MKIERASIKGTLGTYQTNGPQRPNSKAKASSHASHVDKVDVSERAVQVATLKAKLATAPDVRMDLVERIKAQVDAGEYNVDPYKVAEKMLKSKVLDE